MNSDDIKALRALATELDLIGISVESVSLLRTAATDLENANAWEDANLPSVGVRLMHYRTVLVSTRAYGVSYDLVEIEAHAMLKAERAPVGS